MSLLLQQLTKYKIPNRLLQLYLTRSVGNSVIWVWSDTGMLQGLYQFISPKYFGCNDAWLCVLASGWNMLKWHTCLQWLVMQINWWDFLFAVTSTHNPDCFVQSVFVHQILSRYTIHTQSYTHSCREESTEGIHKLLAQVENSSISPCSYVTVLLKRREK